MSVSEQLNQQEIDAAIAALLGRLDSIDAACAGCFPLYARDGRWEVSTGGSWMGGFWAGLWWLRARLGGAPSDQTKAAELCSRLQTKVSSDSLNRSLIFWHGAALGDLWHGDERARGLAERAAAELAGSFNARMGCIALGCDMGGGREGRRRISIDPLASTLALLHHSRQTWVREIAEQHACTTLAACGTADGAYAGGAVYDQGLFSREGQAGNWSRGQAWAMLGLSRAAHCYGEPYLSAALHACRYWQHSRGVLLPLNQLDRPDGVCDPSAAVMSALAMLQLAALTPVNQSLLEQANRQLAVVVRSRYFSVADDPGRQCAAGAFTGNCYRTREGRDELVESSCGTFFLLVSLLALIDRGG